MGKDILENKKIAIIGGGHIGQAFIEGFIKSKMLKKSQIVVSNPSLDKLKNIQKQYKVITTADNNIAAQMADYIILCVKPLIVKQVLEEVAGTVQNKIILSVAAGVTVKKLQESLDNKQKIIRLMPNILISQNKGVIGLYCNKRVTLKEIKKLSNLLGTLGKVFRVKNEEELDILTLISACGPAIISYFIKIISDFGYCRGLSKKTSIYVSFETYKETLIYLSKENIGPQTLINSVSTKGGITEKILNSMESKKMSGLFIDSMNDGLNKLIKLKNHLASP